MCDSGRNGTLRIVKLCGVTLGIDTSNIKINVNLSSRYCRMFSYPVAESVRLLKKSWVYKNSFHWFTNVVTINANQYLTRILIYLTQKLYECILK